MSYKHFRYPNVNSALEAKIPNNAVSSISGTRGSNMSNVGEVFCLP